jgi:branched-chain amino acid transport system substrate-binding protein
MGIVYASLPLTGPSGRLGREVLRGAELAFERVRDPQESLVVLDSGGPDRDARALANAKRAADDRAALAYLGDFHSSQVLATAPLLSAAGLLQVAPVATYVGLKGTTLVRLTPHDGVGAQAIATWMGRQGIHEVLVVHDHDLGYGVAVGEMCSAAARERGLVVRSRPVWDQDEDPGADLGDAQAVLYVGVAGSGAVALWHQLHSLDPGLWLLGSEGVAQSWFARELSPSAAARSRFFVAQRAPFAFYGFEAMALALDAIAESADGREGVLDQARSSRDRDSVIGRYSIDSDGHTTSTAYGRMAIVDQELVWD